MKSWQVVTFLWTKLYKQKSRRLGQAKTSAVSEGHRDWKSCICLKRQNITTRRNHVGKSLDISCNFTLFNRSPRIHNSRCLFRFRPPACALLFAARTRRFIRRVDVLRSGNVHGELLRTHAPLSLSIVCTSFFLQTLKAF